MVWSEHEVASQVSFFWFEFPFQAQQIPDDPNLPPARKAAPTSRSNAIPEHDSRVVGHFVNLPAKKTNLFMIVLQACILFRNKEKWQICSVQKNDHLNFQKQFSGGHLADKLIHINFWTTKQEIYNVSLHHNMKINSIFFRPGKELWTFHSRKVQFLDKRTKQAARKKCLSLLRKCNQFGRIQNSRFSWCHSLGGKSKTLNFPWNLAARPGFF